MSSIWDIVKIGKYEEACLAADREFAETQSLSPLRNKVFALLCLEKYDEVIRLSNDIIIKANGESDGDFVFLGVAHWLLGRYRDAVTVWERATDTKYTDAAGGVGIQLLLFYASVKLQDDKLKACALKQLQTLCKHPTANNWPGPLAGLVLGKLQEADVRSKMSKQPILKARQTCQAAFYIGTMQIASQDMHGYIEHMRESCGQGGACLLEQEYYLARDEVMSWGAS